MMASIWLLWILFFGLGCGAGALFFGGLRHTIKLILGSGPGWLIIAFYLIRFAISFAVLFSAVQLGAGPLLAATAGLTLAGLSALWRERRRDA